MLLSMRRQIYQKKIDNSKSCLNFQHESMTFFILHSKSSIWFNHFFDSIYILIGIFCIAPGRLKKNKEIYIFFFSLIILYQPKKVIFRLNKLIWNNFYLNMESILGMLLINPNYLTIYLFKIYSNHFFWNNWVVYS